MGKLEGIFGGSTTMDLMERTSSSELKVHYEDLEFTVEVLAGTHNVRTCFDAAGPVNEFGLVSPLDATRIAEFAYRHGHEYDFMMTCAALAQYKI